MVAMYLVNRYIMGSDKSDFRYERFQEKDDEDEEAGSHLVLLQITSAKACSLSLRNAFVCGPAPLSIDDQMHAFEQFWAGPMPDALLEVRLPLSLWKYLC